MKVKQEASRPRGPAALFKNLPPKKKPPGEKKKKTTDFIQWRWKILIIHQILKLF